MNEHESASAAADGEPAPAQTHEEPRRNFLVEFAAATLGGLVGLVPAAFGTLFFLDPLFRKKSGGSGDGFIELPVLMSALPEDGTPQKVTVHADIVNVWNKSPNQPVGSVWLRRIQDQVIAFNTICPHLGCAVEHRQAEADFFCPCHLSAFSLEGERTNSIPPRGMDTLEVELREGRVWVKYIEYRGATSEKVPV